MIKQILETVNLAIFAETGLVLFVAIFCLNSLWILCRPRREVAAWARLALEDPLDADVAAAPVAIKGVKR